MKSTLFASLFVLAVCLVGLVCPLPTSNLECLNAFAPSTSARGVNRLDRDSRKPLFQLQITPSEGASGNQDESWTYKVHMAVENELLPFSDAKISIEGRGPCGSGSLTFDPHHFLEAKQISPSCPRLLLTNRKQPMTELPSLLWTPPSCGCVHFRVLVIEGGHIYYADNGDMESGPLSQTVCVHKEATREQHLDALCHVRERYTAAEIMSRPSFLSRHQLETRWMDRHGIEMALELRRSDTRHCCNQKTKESKQTCFEDMRRRRVDSFCEDGYPDIPFSSFRLTHMREKEKNCCYILGERRYSCFASDSELVSGPAVTVLDFSQDETDPVNDLPEFASVKDVDVVQRLRYVTFEKNESQNDNSEEVQDQKNDHVDIRKQGSKGENKNNGRANSKDISKESKHQKQTAATSDPETKTHPKNLQDVDDTRSAPFLTEDRLMLREHLDIMERQPPSEKLTTEETSFFEKPAIAMTSAERRKLRRNGSFRKEQKWSRERLDSGRTASREFFAAQRRVSAELASKRQSSAERGLVPNSMERWLPEYEDSFERSTGLSREAELMASVPPRLTSSERRMGKSSGLRRDGRLDATGGLNFDDQGGASVEETLIKLQRKMERLHLKRECCEAGALAGKHVYGKFTQTWNECGHSADKYVLKTDLFSGTRVCMEQFRKCCVEQAVSGPVMTSSEFREAELMYLNNLERLDSASEFDQLERKGGEPARDEPSEAASGLYRDGISRGVQEGETPEDYEKESEKRFRSMRNQDVDRYEDEDDDEYDGPRRFDETDNNDDDAGDGFDVLDRQYQAPKKSLRKSTAAEDEVEDFDDRTFVGNDGDNEMDFEDKKDKTSMLSKKETDLEADKTRKRHHQMKHDPDDQLDRRTDHHGQGAPGIAETSRDYERSLLASTRSSRRLRNSREGRTSRGRRFRSRSSRRRSSRQRSSRLTSRERRLLASSALSQPALYKPKPASYGKVGALDSQEMAAAHFKGVVDALDSKEMAKAYRGRGHEAAADTDFQRDDFFSRTGSALRSRRRHHFRRYYY